MIVIKTAIPDVLILEPKVFGDERGFFLKVITSRPLKSRLDVKLHLFKIIIQNPKRTYFRGLHFQRGENAQGVSSLCCR